MSVGGTRANQHSRLARPLLQARAEVPVSVFCCRLLGLGLDFAHSLPDDPCRVFAVSAGGVEVADALAYFTRSPLRWLEEEHLVDAAPDPEAYGRLVYLVDDGLAPPDVILGAAALLRSARPRRLVLVVPFARAAFRRAALKWVDEVHTELDHVPRRTLFDELPDREVAERLVARSEGYPLRPVDMEEKVEF